MVVCSVVWDHLQLLCCRRLPRLLRLLLLRLLFRKRGREEGNIEGPVRCSFILWGFFFLLLRGGGDFL